MLHEILRSLGLAATTSVEPIAGGASGAAWIVTARGDRWVLRLERSARVAASRLAALGAARDSGLPAPAVVADADTAGGHATLLAWLAGKPMLEALRRDPSAAGHWGRRAGELHRRVHDVRAPAAVLDVLDPDAHPFSAGSDLPGLPTGGALLHLDWHPGNLVVDEATGSICGIVDWDNARAGHPWLDLARTAAMLEAEPSLVHLPVELRARVTEFHAAWAEGYGVEARQLPSACRAWAGRVMLADLAHRYADAPGALDVVRDWTER